MEGYDESVDEVEKKVAKKGPRPELFVKGPESGYHPFVPPSKALPTLMLAGPSVEDVSGWINDRLFVRAMIDSGSRPHNFLSKGTADKLRAMGLKRVDKPITGVLLNGTHFHCNGYFKISYWISNELSLNIIAYELDTLPVELLLG